MQKHLEEIELELVARIYKEFLVKFNGNKSEFAKASNCSETTVRRVFRNEQRMTVDLFLRFCFLPYICIRIGEVAEWSIAAVLKTVDCHRSGGSNPSLSAFSSKPVKN